MTLSNSQAAWRQRCLENWGLPRRVDLMRLARGGQGLSGAFAVNRLDRLSEDLAQSIEHTSLPGVDDKGVVWFEVSASARTGRRNTAVLKVQSVLGLTCQRCMQTLWLEVDEQAVFELFGSESQMQSALASEEIEPDGPEPLLVDGPLDLVQLIEDQLILAVPFVPKHEDCQAAKTEAGEPIQTPERQSPFKVLGQLKGDPK